jgi:K+-transporting ATPase ATPase C chain
MNSIVYTSKVQHLVTGFRASLALLFVCGVVYTGTVTQLGSALFPEQAKGSLIQLDNVVIGSEFIAQPFVDNKYFYSRPSAADYDPMATGGSNLAPSNPELRQRVMAASLEIQAREAVGAIDIPVDLLAASGAGLDPHISPAAAKLQVARVAQARQLTQAQVSSLVAQFIEPPQWGIFGQARVNVLRLNLALDQFAKQIK